MMMLVIVGFVLGLALFSWALAGIGGAESYDER